MINFPYYRKARSQLVWSFCVIVFACSSANALAVECDVMLQDHRSTDMSLSYEEFDQTPDQGFRVLAANACYAEAATLIQEYIAANSATENSLRWHVAQLSASAGDYPTAITFSKQVLSESEDFSVKPLRWNDYVLATIAFLEKDMDALELHRDRVAEGTDFAGNAMNLKLLDALVKYFDESYAYATSHIE